MAVDQRPLSIGEILDKTAAIYRKNFLPLVSITAPPAAAMIGLVGIFVLIFVTRMPAAKTDSTVGIELILLGVAFLLLGAPLLLGITAVSLGASNHAVLCAHRGLPITIRGSYSYAFTRFWRLVWLLVLQALLAGVIPYIVFIILAVAAVAITALLSPAMKGTAAIVLGVLAVVGILALIVLCVWLWIRMALGCPVVVAEDKFAWDAIKRSNQLTKGSRGRIFLMFVLVWILVMAVSMVFVAPVDIGVAIFFRKSLTGGQPPTTFAVALQLVNLAIDFAVRTVVMPIYAIALMLFYFDQRTRQEGYDIELLMARAGWDAATAASPSMPEAHQAQPADFTTGAAETPTTNPESPIQDPQWSTQDSQ